MKYYFASLILVIMSLLPFPANAELLPGYENSFPQKITKTVNGVSFDSDYDNGSLLNVEPDGSNTFQCELYTEDGEIGPGSTGFDFACTERREEKSPSCSITTSTPVLL